MTKTKLFTISIMLLLGFMMIFEGCKKDEETAPEAPNTPEAPEAPVNVTVTTTVISGITYTSANCGGNVSADGDAEISARGVCWSTSQSPTINDSHTSDGQELGDFTSAITNLSHGTKHYVRAYAIYNNDTIYGDQVYFFTNLKSIDKWTRMGDFAGQARSGAFTFSLNGKGYIGGGSFYETKSSDIKEIRSKMIQQKKEKENGNKTLESLYDLWEYDAVSDSWTQKADVPSTTFIDPAFSINGKGYIVGYSKIYEYDPISNNWISKSPSGYSSGSYSVGFSTDSKGYYGTLEDDKKFYEYDPSTNKCKKIAYFTGQERNGIFSFSFPINNKGYIGGGGYFTDDYEEFIDLYDTWEYDPVTDLWVQKANCPISTNGGGFSICNYGFVISYEGLREYNTTSNTWKIKADFPQSYIYKDIPSFNIGNRGYILDEKDFYIYEP